MRRWEPFHALQRPLRLMLRMDTVSNDSPGRLPNPCLTRRCSGRTGRSLRSLSRSPLNGYIVGRTRMSFGREAIESAMTLESEELFSPESLERVRRRAQQAAAAGENTFPIPEAAGVAEFVAAMVPVGPLRTEAERWLGVGAGYHSLARLAARAATSMGGDEAPGSAVYVPKAAGELEPILRLWPAVLAVPTTMSFRLLDLVALRAFPVHPLGLVGEPTWADGRLCSPAEYFFHDLDHARFKIREDLRVEGVEIPDAYQGGTALDARTGQHRIILPAAEGRIGSTLWDRAEPRRELADRLLAFAASLEGPRAAAADLLLFEIIYEKSHPLEEKLISRELASDAHVVKIRSKWENGFYGVPIPEVATIAALDEVRLAIKDIV